MSFARKPERNYYFLVPRKAKDSREIFNFHLKWLFARIKCLWNTWGHFVKKAKAFYRIGFLAKYADAFLLFCYLRFTPCYFLLLDTI